MRTLKYIFTFLMLLAGPVQKARAGEKHNVIVEVKPMFLSKQLAIGSSTYVSANGDTISIDRFRFYLSGLILTLENGEKYIETNSYHLVDIENPSSFKISLLNVPAGKISAISFNIGIDSTTSVSGAMAGDLDPVKGMYWAWNSGYINAKLEGTCKTFNGKKNHLFEFHIGGYLPGQCALRNVNLNLNDSHTTKQIVLESDVSFFIEGLDLRKENNIMIPGKEAMKIADQYQKMFRISQ